MAADLTRNPWKFDAATQSYSRSATATVGNANSLSTRQKVFVKRIVIESGATGGTYEVLDGASGKSLTGPQTLGANASTEVVLNSYVEGVYIGSFGSDGTILVYHGDV